MYQNHIGVVHDASDSLKQSRFVGQVPNLPHKSWEEECPCSSALRRDRGCAERFSCFRWRFLRSSVTPLVFWRTKPPSPPIARPASSCWANGKARGKARRVRGQAASRLRSICKSESWCAEITPTIRPQTNNRRSRTTI